MRRRRRCSRSPPCRAAASPYPPTGDRPRRMRRRAEKEPPAGSAAPDSFAPTRCARSPAVRARPQRDAEIVGGEVSWIPPGVVVMKFVSTASAVGLSIRLVERGLLAAEPAGSLRRHHLRCCRRLLLLVQPVEDAARLDHATVGVDVGL